MLLLCSGDQSFIARGSCTYDVQSIGLQLIVSVNDYSALIFVGLKSSSLVIFYYMPADSDIQISKIQ